MSADAMKQITTVRSVESVTESLFYIPMTGPAARPRRSLKHDDTFIVLDSHGDIGASAGGPDGLFNADTRYLARLEMMLDDVQPLLLGSICATAIRARPSISPIPTCTAMAVWCCARTPCISCARSSCGAARPINGSVCRTTGMIRRAST